MRNVGELARSEAYFFGRVYLVNMIWYELDEYERILDGIVPACVDVLITDNENRILLGKRRFKPNPDWWLIGGRMRVGENIFDTTNRNLAKELSKFKYEYMGEIGHYVLQWPDRAEPSNKPVTHLLIATKVKAITTEIEDVTGSHSELRWFTADELESINITKELSDVIRDGLK